MKARVRFVNYPYFSHPPDKLVCRGSIPGRAERESWTMIFTVTKQISAVEYEGNLRWEAAPHEHDFGKGVKFNLIAGPRGLLDGKEKEEKAPDVRSLKEKKNDKKAGKDPGKAATKVRSAEKPGKGPKDPKEPKEPKDPTPAPSPEPVEVTRDPKNPRDNENKALSRLPKDSYVRSPKQQCKIAEGVLLG